MLVIGPGDMGARIVLGLAASGDVDELVLAGLPSGPAREAIGIVCSTSDVRAQFETLDCTVVEAVEDLIRRTRPHVIIQCASLLSPWAFTGRTDRIANAFAGAGLAVALPMQLPVLMSTMRAVRATGFAGPVANLSFPDATNPILARLDLAPTIGLGNVTMHLLRVRGALRAELGAGPQLPLVRVLGHHHQVYGVMRAQPPPDPADRVRVFVGEDGQRRDELAYRGHPFVPGIVYNQVTAVAVVAAIRALLPGARRTRISVPAPLGLPGGYPVVIDDGRVTLDLPPGQTLDEAASWMSRVARGDGIDAIRDDGTVVFTQQAQRAVADVAPWLAEPLHPHAAAERAARIQQLLAS